MTRILLLGANGQLGVELQAQLAPLGELVAGDRSQFDLATPDRLSEQIRDLRPDWIVNAAAYTAVDKAESDRELAQTINGDAPGKIAAIAEEIGAIVLHVSTDYVFDGSKSTPYLETDSPQPLGAYGESKLAGEKGIEANCQHYAILRTAWVYGVGGKGNFVKTMLRLGREREELRVVCDQIGSPTWTVDLASAIARLLPQLQGDRSLSGIYHVTNSGIASWYDFSVAIFEEAEALGIPLQIKRVAPITTAEYPTPAKRPAFSVLSGQKMAGVLGDRLPHWRASLRQMLRDWQNCS